jgi:hypothetical protein
MTLGKAKTFASDWILLRRNAEVIIYVKQKEIYPCSDI